jgi:hypothetical protein
MQTDAPTATIPAGLTPRDWSLLGSADLHRAVTADQAVLNVALEWAEGDLPFKDLMVFAARRGHAFSPSWPDVRPEVC